MVKKNHFYIKSFSYYIIEIVLYYLKLFHNCKKINVL